MKNFIINPIIYVNRFLHKNQTESDFYIRIDFHVKINRELYLYIGIYFHIQINRELDV